MKMKHSAKFSQYGQFLTRHLSWLSLIIIIFWAGFWRYRLLDVPLERDEGEYAYAGQLLLQGLPPYQYLYNMKLPGIYAAYALILALFGQTLRGIHWGLLFLNAGTIVLVFGLTKRLVDAASGVVAAACFALLSLGQPVQGLQAHAEHFVIFPALAGLIVLLWALDEHRQKPLFFSGLLLGIGFMMKQHGAAFIGLAGFYIVVHSIKIRPFDWQRRCGSCLLFLGGAILPYVVTCLLFLLAGLFDEFWRWTVEYAVTYSAQVPVEYAWPKFKEKAYQIGSAAPLIWGLAGLGLLAPIWDQTLRARFRFGMLFTLFSFLAICPGFYFRQHYFILILPVAALLAGTAIRAAANLMTRLSVRARNNNALKYSVPIFLFVLCLTVSVWQQRAYLFTMSPRQLSRATYGRNPFPESIKIASFIRNRTTAGERIAIIGSEPQIYFYARRQAATGYIYMYPLMESHDLALKMQRELISEVEAISPEYLLFINVYSSWLSRPDSPRDIFHWFEEYSKDYIPVGLVEIDHDKTLYFWAPNVKWPPQASFWVAVLQRKNN
ncbi:ArnT family glycosyltransferase [candidate division CSSED10-310 bacterium]|uniref:ArnT family glycosyltransferase n=1 Tax=candidate division CSSED10-310 bacterium TaxID=2855610 RepID=A0ABV6Z1T3_UNCC1